MAAATKSPPKKSPSKKSAPKKAASTTKSVAKKAASTTKSAAKKSSTNARSAVKKSATKTKSAAKRSVAKAQAPVRKSPAKKTPAKKSTVKKSTAKKSTAKKASAASSPNDAIAVLKADHRRVTDLFDKFDGLGDRAHKMRESTVDMIVEELSVHAGIEEEVFYPAVRERLAASKAGQVLEALEEHHVVKLLLKEVQSMSSTSERYAAKVTVLREIVDHHVEEEEDELFKMVRQAFTRSELVQLGDDINAARSSAPTRPHPAAPDTPPGNVVANVIAAPFDAATGITTRAAEAVRGLID